MPQVINKREIVLVWCKDCGQFIWEGNRSDWQSASDEVEKKHPEHRIEMVPDIRTRATGQQVVVK